MRAAQGIASLDEIVGGVHNLERAEMLEAGKRDELIVRHVEVDEASQRRESAPRSPQADCARGRAL